MLGSLLRLQDKEMALKDGRMKNQKVKEIMIYLEELKQEKLKLKKMISFQKMLLKSR